MICPRQCRERPELAYISTGNFWKVPLLLASDAGEIRKAFLIICWMNAFLNFSSRRRTDLRSYHQALGHPCCDRWTASRSRFWGRTAFCIKIWICIYIYYIVLKYTIICYVIIYICVYFNCFYETQECDQYLSRDCFPWANERCHRVCGRLNAWSLHDWTKERVCGVLNDWPHSPCLPRFDPP